MWRPQHPASPSIKQLWVSSGLRSTTTRLKRWPSNSPDHVLSEHLWALLDKQLWSMCLCASSHNTPSGFSGLQTANSRPTPACRWWSCVFLMSKSGWWIKLIFSGYNSFFKDYLICIIFVIHLQVEPQKSHNKNHKSARQPTYMNAILLFY